MAENIWPMLPEAQAETEKPPDVPPLFQPVHAFQQAVLESEARFILAAAGTGGGKTTIGARWIVDRIAQDPTALYLVVAPTFPLLRDAALRSFLDLADQGGVIGRMMIQSHTFQLAAGGAVMFRSAEDPRSIESVHVKAGWFDEAGQFTSFAWVVLQARLGRHLGRALFTTTPYGLNWLYEDVYLRWRAGDKNYDVISWRTEDNGWYPPEEVERARATMRPEIFAMRYEGQFVRAAGLVHPTFHTAIVGASTVPGSVNKADARSRYGGIDFGYHNPTAIYNCVLDSDDVLWILDERYVSESTIEEHLPFLRKDTLYVGDPSGSQWIEEITSKGVFVKPGCNDVNLRVQSLEEKVRKNKLRVVRERCPHLICESEVYGYDDRTGKPVKQNDHGMNAIQYVAAYLASQAKPPSPIRLRGKQGSGFGVESARGFR